VVRFAGENIVGWRPERIAKAGLVRTFQNAAMFAGMTVADNLATGQFLASKTGVWQTLLRTPSFRLEKKETGDHVDRVLDLLRLRRDVIAGELPYGDQRVLGLGIALMTQPKLLLLDEPAAGLSPDEAKLMGRLIRTINDQGITVLLIEHNMSLVMSVSEHIIVLKQGKKLAEGTPRSIREHRDVVEAYLGVDA
jgi:branched-chain amino acid transport system ATP-binding protein